MGPHYLDRLFAPRAIVVIGASEREGSVGRQMFENLRASGFGGPIYAVNPKHETVLGEVSHPNVGAVCKLVDLAVIATPAAAVPQLIRECGECHVRAAIVLSAGFSEGREGAGLQLEQAVLDAARQYGVRIVGPNCLGLMRPLIGLNATFSKNTALAGDLALVSQSGALCTAILDWATPHHIGFSAMVSLGDAADVDFGDVLDYLALDPHTRSILLYIEGIRHARGFMSGLRAAARLKSVIVVKAGRHGEAARAALSHTGALVGAEDVFDAALARAGAVRAGTVEQLFSAAQILASRYRASGPRLAIVTNAGGPGVLATDRAVELDLQLAVLGDATLAQLDQALPAHWSRGNPVDLIGDATPERYRAALAACLADDGVDGVLVMLTPQAMTQPVAAAQAVIEVAKTSDTPVLACWMGEQQVEPAWQLFSGAHLPYFRTPEAAVEAYAYLASYVRNQGLLLQVPGPLAERSESDIDGARLLIEGALAEGRTLLSTTESKALLAAFRIAVTPTVEAHSASEALVLAEAMGLPVAMKISSPDITHKSDVDGVRLNVATAQAVRATYQELVDEARRLRPDARIHGVTIERMHPHRHGRELMVGMVRDAAFGPVIAFGAGGTAVEVLQDRAVALPPLNAHLSRRLIEHTRVAKLLGAFRNLPPANIDAIEAVLQRVSEMVCELPHLRELDINPLMADENGAVALDARVVVERPRAGNERYAHMAISPYPAHLATHWQLADGTDITVRPIRPEDARMEEGFVRALSPESRYFRFMQALQELTPAMLVRFTQIDYDREMALIAVREHQGAEEELGVARYTVNPDGTSGEFGLVVADAWHNRGIGSRLLARLIDVAREQGLKQLDGEVLASNANMLALVAELGFAIFDSEGDPTVKRVSRRLH